MPVPGPALPPLDPPPPSRVKRARMTSAEAKELLPPFLDFVKTLRGDEKSEAQTFLDRLFKAQAGRVTAWALATGAGSS